MMRLLLLEWYQIIDISLNFFIVNHLMLLDSGEADSLKQLYRTIIY